MVYIYAHCHLADRSVPTLFSPVNPSRDRWVLLITALLGLLLALLAWQWDARRERVQFEDRFRFMATERAGSIQAALDAVLAVSAATAGLFNASEKVTRREFSIVLHDQLRQHPEIRAVEWLPRVRHNERTAFERNAVRDGYPDFHLTQIDSVGAILPAAARDTYFPVYYAQPQAENWRALGFDAYSRKNIAHVMDQARDTGKVWASEAFRLIQDPEQQLTTAIYRPIYRNGIPLHSVAARREALTGFVTVLFVLPALAENALRPLQPVGLDWMILDAAAPQRIMHFHSARTRSTAVPTPTEAELESGLSIRLPLHLGGREWQMLIAPSQGFNTRFGDFRSGFVLVSGLIMTGLLTLYLYSRQRDVRLLKEAAYHDDLTGLPNRKLLQDRLAHALKFSARRNNVMAVLFLDIDGFKHVNDTGGHAIGDKLLREVAYRLKCSLRESDTVARLGGDEFVVLAEGLPRESDAGILAAKIVHVLAEPFDFGGPLVQVSVSIGVSFYARDGQTPDELLRYADIAMYQAKDAGRNGYRFYNDTEPDQAYLIK